MKSLIVALLLALVAGPASAGTAPIDPACRATAKKYMLRGSMEASFGGMRLWSLAALSRALEKNPGDKCLLSVARVAFRDARDYWQSYVANKYKCSDEGDQPQEKPDNCPSSKWKALGDNVVYINWCEKKVMRLAGYRDLPCPAKKPAIASAVEAVDAALEGQVTDRCAQFDIPESDRAKPTDDPTLLARGGGCAKGLILDAAPGLLKKLWDITYDIIVPPLAPRPPTLAELEAKSASQAEFRAKLFSNPGKMAQEYWDGLVKGYSDKIQHFNCLNAPAQERRICNLFGQATGAIAALAITRGRGGAAATEADAAGAAASGSAAPGAAASGSAAPGAAASGSVAPGAAADAVGANTGNLLRLAPPEPATNVAPVARSGDLGSKAAATGSGENEAVSSLSDQTGKAVAPRSNGAGTEQSAAERAQAAPATPAGPEASAGPAAAPPAAGPPAVVPKAKASSRPSANQNDRGPAKPARTAKADRGTAEPKAESPANAYKPFEAGDWEKIKKMVDAIDHPPRILRDEYVMGFSQTPKTQVELSTQFRTLLKRIAATRQSGALTAEQSRMLDKVSQEINGARSNLQKKIQRYQEMESAAD